MTSEEFIQEVHNSVNAPLDFDDVYKEFITYQNLAIETLIEFDGLCRQFGIPYQLAFGSLLGAIRDNGQIPWDYDVDVFVPIDYRNILVDYLNAYLSKDYYFYCPQNSVGCRHETMRICPKGFRSEELHVDVFFLMGLPDDEFQRKKHTSAVKTVSYQRFFKCVKIKSEWHGSFKRLSVLLIKKAIGIALNLKDIDSRYEQLVFKYPFDSSQLCTTADIWAEANVFPKNIMSETIDYETKCGVFKVPKGYEQLLKRRYGDYNSLPSLRDRIHDVYEHYDLIRKYGKRTISNNK